VRDGQSGPPDEDRAKLRNRFIELGAQQVREPDVDLCHLIRRIELQHFPELAESQLRLPRVGEGETEVIAHVGIRGCSSTARRYASTALR